MVSIGCTESDVIFSSVFMTTPLQEWRYFIKAIYFLLAQMAIGSDSRKKLPVILYRPMRVVNVNLHQQIQQ